MSKNKKLLQEFDKLTNDKDRWQWIKDNQASGIVVNLDNDDTFGTLENKEDPDDIHVFQLSNYIGWGDGVIALLNTFGIRNELV